MLDQWIKRTPRWPLTHCLRAGAHARCVHWAACLCVLVEREGALDAVKAAACHAINLFMEAMEDEFEPFLQVGAHPATCTSPH